MTLQNYMAMMPKAPNFIEGYQQGTMIRNDQQQNAQEQEKQRNIKSLSDLYSSPDFQKLDVDSQIQQALPIVAKVSPQAAFDLTKERQKEEQATKMKGMQSVMGVVEMFSKNGNSEAVSALFPVLKKYIPELADVESVDLVGNDLTIKSKIMLKEGNSFNLPAGDYMANYKTNPVTGKNKVVSMESIAEKYKPQAGTVKGVPTFGRFDASSGDFFDAEGEVIKDFQPGSTANINNYLGVNGGAGGGGLSKSDQAAANVFNRHVGDLPNALTKDVDLKPIREKLRALRQVMTLTKLQTNIANVGTVYSLAKIFDPSGRLSDRDFQVVAAGSSASVLARLDRAFQKHITKGTSLTAADLRDFEIVAKALRDQAQADYQSMLGTKKDTDLAMGEVYAPTKLKLIENIYSKYQKDPMYTVEQKATAPIKPVTPVSKKLEKKDVDAKNKLVRLPNGKVVSMSEAKKAGYTWK